VRATKAQPAKKARVAQRASEATQGTNALGARLKEIEIKLCFQDDTLEKLNQIIIHQQDQIDSLARRFDDLELQSWQAPALSRGAPREPPPHY